MSRKNIEVASETETGEQYEKLEFPRMQEQILELRSKKDRIPLNTIHSLAIQIQNAWELNFVSNIIEYYNRLGPNSDRQAILRLSRTGTEMDWASDESKRKKEIYTDRAFQLNTELNELIREKTGMNFRLSIEDAIQIANNGEWGVMNALEILLCKNALAQRS